MKPFEYGKSRLASLISDEERYRLNRALLTQTLSVISKCNFNQHVIVISKGQEALTIAQANNFECLQEYPPFGLNRSLRKVVKALNLKQASSITVIPADLPLLGVEELNFLFELRNTKEGMIIVPDRHHVGTNILSLKPMNAIPFKYGRASFSKHVQLAKMAEIACYIHDSSFLGLDLDTKQDLQVLMQLCPDIQLAVPEITCFEHIFQAYKEPENV